MSITSLPSKYGIGTIGKSAYQFVDFLRESDQTYWQILPIGPTSYGDSPYQSFSTFAGNPYFIDLDLLIRQGLLNQADIAYTDWGKDRECVDYEKIFNSRFKVLHIAYENAVNNTAEQTNIAEFLLKNESWVCDYALYMAIKVSFGNVSWIEWDEDIRLRKPQAMAQYAADLESEVDFWVFVQAKFYEQWNKLKRYASKNGIKIIGDIPIYVAYDSADVWSNPDLFCLDENLVPIRVAGCPPDYFSPTGQLWGNPLYNWETMKKDGYSWWIDRVNSVLSMYDMVRIDHFRGFESYYTIPFGDPTAENGEWVKGPGIGLFKAINKKLGKINVIAEDLGFLTQEVSDMLAESGYPGMEVMQFAFDPSGNSTYLPHNHEANSICYTGTHDNETLAGWLKSISNEELAFCKQYLKLDLLEGYNWGVLRGCWGSVCQTAIAPLQDFLNLSSKARMNIPSTIGGNWTWRVKPEMVTMSLARRINRLTKTYGRSAISPMK